MNKAKSHGAKPLKRPKKINRLKVEHDLKVTFRAGFNPVEIATEADWPVAAR